MNTTVFVTGGTGVLGRPAVRDLVASGRTVRAVARTDEKAARTAGCRCGADRRSTCSTPTAVKAATAGCDAILHLATHIPRMRDMRKPDAWTENSRLRNEATANLIDAARVARHRHLREGVDHVRLPGPGQRLDRRDASRSAPRAV